jgi:hypothetical protein
MSAADASRSVRESAPEAPLTAEELLRLENIVPEEDARPFGVQTRSARLFHLLDSSPGAGGEVSLEASELADGAFEIASRGRLVNGLPVLKGTVQSTRAHSRLARTSRWSARPRIPRQDESLPSFLPGGMPLSYHPEFLAVSGRKATRDADGRMLIRSQAQAHLLEDGDQRRAVFPDTFPLAAVCKVIVREQKMAGGPVQVSDSTGFLIGRRSMMGAGHAATDPFSFSKSIEVIPAMWAGHSCVRAGVQVLRQGVHRGWSAMPSQGVQSLRGASPWRARMARACGEPLLPGQERVVDFDSTGADHNRTENAGWRDARLGVAALAVERLCRLVIDAHHDSEPVDTARGRFSPGDGDAPCVQQRPEARPDRRTPGTRGRSARRPARPPGRGRRPAPIARAPAPHRRARRRAR